MDEFDDYDDEQDWDDDEDADCHAGPGRNLIEMWQRCGMAGTEYCDFECKFARDARALIHQRRERGKANRRSHTTEMFPKGAA